MSQNEDLAPHRRENSLTTNASGLAESTLSNGDATSLSHFPAPPEEIPITPLRSEFDSASPARSAFGLSPPVTPTSRQFRAQSPGRGQPGSARKDPEAAAPISPLAPNRQRGPVKGPRSRIRENDEWHEGSSKIVVDDAEERMLSTSFITNLLSSTEDITSVGSHTRSAPKKYAKSFVTSDGTSAISEMTYPPPAGFRRTPSPYVARGEDNSRPSPLKQQPQSTATTPEPPGSFLTLDEDGRSLVGSTATYDGNDPQGGSVIRTASMTRKLGARGASVVGFAPATLRRVSNTPTNELSSSTHAPGHDSLYSMPTPDEEEEEEEGQRLTIPAHFEHRPISTPYSPAQPSSVGVRNSGRTGTTRHSHSTRSQKSRFSGFVSRLSTMPAVGGWFGPKPLPRIPVNTNMTIAAEADYRKEDNALALPELVHRAGALEGMLEKGDHPHKSLNSTMTTGYWGKGKDREDTIADAPWEAQTEHDKDGAATVGSVSGFLTRTRKRQSRDLNHQEQIFGQPDSPKFRHKPVTKQQKVLIIVAICALLFAIVLGVGLGVGLGKKKHTLPALPSCSGNMTGKACNLDATCVCTSSLPGQCGPLAQNLITLVPAVNKNFGTNFTANSMSNALFQVQGAPPSNQCAYQAIVVDVAPALDASQYPNRTQWTQSALLWNLVQSQDTTALSSMQAFISKAPWSNLGQADGPISSGDTSSFNMTASGFIFNYVSQTVSQPNATFVDNGQPSSAQIAQVGGAAQTVLDRMYSYALASSTQREQAAANFWRSTLGQKPEDFASFMTAIATSTILLPFDATASPGGQKISGFLTNSSSTQFPIPIACYPGLNASQLQEVNALETTIFNLPAAATVSQFDTSCFAGRPIYGVLDILKLRLPFIDSRTGVAKQAAALQSATAPRAVVYSGEILSALPGANQTQNSTQSQQLDPRQYGTTNHLNHVMLDFLTSIPDTNIATDLVEFVLSGSTTPPSNTSDLYKAISSIPTLEVAVFGTINPSDISYVASSFSTPSGSLFFGSDQSLALRDWAIVGSSSSVVWAASAGAPQVVRDSSLTNANFQSVWEPAYNFLHSSPNGVTVNVGNITNAFQATGQFSS